MSGLSRKPAAIVTVFAPVTELTAAIGRAASGGSTRHAPKKTGGQRPPASVVPDWL